MIPPALGRLYSDRLVFFTMPLRVAITTWRTSSNSRTARQLKTFSPSCRLSRFTTARPLAVRLSNGRS